MDHRFSPRINKAKEIAWKDWGPEPFQQAKESGKPVLLSLSAVWCHWCHVMDETTYSDERVMALVKDRFVPIRVDNDQRPDINDRYNLGGWPTTAFLSPAGDLLTGGTYLPPDDMVENLKRVADWWDEHKEDPLPEPPQVRGKENHKPSHQDVDRAYQTVRATYDSDHGGFGRAPKFPHTEVLLFLLDLDLVRKEPEIRVMVERSLLGMVEGGLYDPVEGGFFRYATRKDWSEPHYEKMLADHASLLEAVVTAHQRWGSPDLLQAAIGAGDYLAGTLFTGTHFFGSQDADEHYYALDREGRSALPVPFKDPVLYTDWNCQAARSMVRAGILLGKKSWVERGRQAFEAVLDHALKGDHLAHTDQKGAVTGLLTDAVSLGLAANFLWAVTGEERYRRASDQAADILLTLMDDEGFRDRSGEGEGGLSRPLHPLQDNARAARFFLERKDIFDDKRAGETVERALRATSQALDGQGLMECAHAHLVLLKEMDPVLIDLPSQADGELLAKAIALEFPRKAYRFDPQAPGVVLCLGDRCLAPARDAQELLLRASDLRGDKLRDGGPRMLMGRIPTGADLLGFFEELAAREGLQTGWVSGLGAVESATLAFFDQEKQVYESFSPEGGPFEIVSLTGNISIYEGRPFAHLHALLGRRDGSTVGGHLMKGTVVYTGEYAIQERPGPALERHPDASLGLRLWPS